ncbi:gliding motility-associated C-terminal domain-containing protein [Psychroflexus salarius]|uniref:Gliding motility-associated C-terminal domain-containing protein n=1 Tax=Psychroflexus salarius TaxID=1155689 RepID=A0A1M4VNV1_9FLAO|nr:T9SS type B sorting domain-containing protein [Psychroflexus salarius]SHE70781.1 gliding motility-associated C-terminal domain-containing protein [Psychroflexus salarius]
MSHNYFTYFYLSFLFLIILNINAQTPTVIPLELRAQYNGQYDYKIVGNTLNEVDNKLPGPCEMLSESSANLNLAPGQTLEAAYLYWSGIGDGLFDPEIQLNGQSLFADEINVVDPQQNGIALYYGSFKDITNIIDQQGNGLYNFSDLDLNPIIGNYCSTGQYYAGWSILVIYKDTTLPTQQVNVYDGLASVYGQIGDITSSAIINIQNLNIINTNNARMGFLAWNGSSNSFFNESISFNGNLLSNPPLNPSDNPFNGTNSYTGTDDLYNMDLDVFDISNFIAVGDTDGNITFTSSLDRLIQNVVTVTRSELPDATVQLTNFSGIGNCNAQSLSFEATVYNLNSSDLLPANTPVSVFVLDENNEEVFLDTFFTQNIIPINGSETQFLTLAIPPQIPNNTTLILKANTLEDGSQPINEANVLNNNFSADLIIPQSPAINDQPLTVNLCDDVSNGVFVNLTEFDISIKLNPKHDVVYYQSQTDFDNNLPINQPDNFQINANTTQVIAEVVNPVSGCASTTQTIITIQVANIPIIDFYQGEDLVICIDFLSNTIISAPILDTQLNETDYTFEWFLDGELLNFTGNSLEVQEAGFYEVIVTEITTNCQTSYVAEVIVSSIPDFEVNVIGQNFNQNNSIEITDIQGVGDFEFSVNGQNWQNYQGESQLIFSNLPGGEIQVIGRSLAGCGQNTKSVLLLNYPEFFTPNNDGFNDTWSITNLPDAKVFIFDRFGKLIQKLNQDNNAWDGTFNGKAMPTSDYWFILNYKDPKTGEPKRLKANFTLKR